MSPTEACIFAEVKRLGGSEVEFRRLLRNPAYVLDPTESTASVSYRTFWRDTVLWLTAHREALTDEECDLVLAWAIHEYTEGERPGAPPFSWKGRRVRGVLERSIHYYREIERPFFSHQWQGHGWDWMLDNGPNDQWAFVELTSGEEMFREGRAMHHCVSSYVGRCVSDTSAIISVRHNDIRKLTVEINPKTRQVVQALGPYNRQAQSHEKKVLSKWIETIVRRARPNTRADSST